MIATESQADNDYLRRLEEIKKHKQTLAAKDEIEDLKNRVSILEEYIKTKI